VNTVIGGGNVLEIPREKYRVVKAERTLPYSRALGSRDLGNCVQDFFEAHTDQLLEPAELALTSGFTMGEVTVHLKEMERAGDVLAFRDKGFFSRKRYDRLRKELPRILQDLLSKDPMKRGSLLAKGKERHDIALALHHSVVHRAVGMVKRISTEQPIVFAGGVARNACMVRNGYPVSCNQTNHQESAGGTGPG
jgi:hypothetical protein